MGVSAVVFTMIGVVMILFSLPPNKQHSDIQYYGYEDLEVEESVIKKGNFYNFGHYSLRFRFLTLDIESVAKDKVVWSSPIDQSFISCASQDKSLSKCKQQVITDIKKQGAKSVLIEGTFRDCQSVYYTVEFQELVDMDDKPKLQFTAKCQSDYMDMNRVYFRTRSSPFEAFYGLGEQSLHANLKGGIYNTTKNQSVMVSTHNRSILVGSNADSMWDFQDDWCINILVFGGEVRGWIINAPDIKKLLSRVTQITGRTPPLPEWTQMGVIVGMHGGDQKLSNIIESCRRNDIPVAAFWCHDHDNEVYVAGTPSSLTTKWVGSSWTRHVSARSGLVAMLSGGISGMSLMHSDVGAYIDPHDLWHHLIGASQDQDQLIRWLELGAFGAILRTHERNTTDNEVQVYDAVMLHYLRRNAYLFKQLSAYRVHVMRQVGLPLTRALVLEYQQDMNVVDVDDQFMMGSELMVAPIVYPNTFTRKVYFPKVSSKYSQNFWVHVWSGEKINGCACYKMVEVPYDQPAAYYPYSSEWESRFVKLFGEVSKIT